MVLVTGGGENSSNLLTTAELYNPATGTWTLTGNMKSPRSNHAATRLSNGDVLVAGGEDNSTATIIAKAEWYNPTTGVWTLTSSMNSIRADQTLTLLKNGQVLVAGGEVDFDVGTATAELFMV